MPITQPIGKKNQNGPRRCLMGSGGVVWGEKTEYKKSRETVPLIIYHPGAAMLEKNAI